MVVGWGGCRRCRISTFEMDVRGLFGSWWLWEEWGFVRAEVCYIGCLVLGSGELEWSKDRSLQSSQSHIYKTNPGTLKIILVARIFLKIAGENARGY